MNTSLRSSSRICAIMALLVTLALSQAASAQTVTVFQSGFEPGEGYAPGALNNQNGWFAYIGEDLNFGRVTGVNPLSGSQSILLDGGDVQLGTFGNYAAIGRFTHIAPALNGNPLRFIEITGLAAIADSTPQANHVSIGDVALYRGDDPEVTDARLANDNGQLLFGYGLPNAVPVQASVAFEFRHVLDYQTGLMTGWMNGQIAYQSLPPFSTLVPDSLYFELASHLDALQFDTRIWFDNIRVTATYAPESVGDMNCDNIVDLADVPHFVQALLGTGFTGCDLNRADMNVDGLIDGRDMSHFSAALIQP